MQGQQLHAHTLIAPLQGQTCRVNPEEKVQKMSSYLLHLPRPAQLSLLEPLIPIHLFTLHPCTLH